MKNRNYYRVLWDQKLPEDVESPLWSHSGAFLESGQFKMLGCKNVTYCWVNILNVITSLFLGLFFIHKIF